jgi:hypothetical protein
MAVLPNSEQAILDIRKIEEYCLNSEHPRGRHKARLFRELIGLSGADSAWLRLTLLAAVRTADAVQLRRGSVWQSMAGRRSGIATRQKRCDKNRMDRADRRGIAAIRYLLGHVMTDQSARRGSAAVLDVVALLADAPVEGLARGQVGTVVESLDERTALVEFADDQGRAYAIVPCARSDLLVLHYVPQEA